MKYVILTSIAVVAAGCVHVANPFVRLRPDYAKVDKDALAKVALEIEKAVSGGNREPNIAGASGISIDTEEIRQSIRTRAARHELIATFLDTGHLFEARNGLVTIKRTSAYKKSTTSKQRDRDALLVLDENNARWMLYEGIIKASKLPPGALSAVQETFHRAQVEMLKPGQKYEDESGAIVDK